MSNYVTEFTAKYVGVLNETHIGDYSNNGPEYQNLLTAYDIMMSSIEIGDAENIKENKRTFDKLLSKVQLNVQKAWNKINPKEEYPEQNSIHGLNLVIEIIAEAEKLK